MSAAPTRPLSAENGASATSLGGVGDRQDTRRPDPNAAMLPDPRDKPARSARRRPARYSVARHVIDLDLTGNYLLELSAAAPGTRFRLDVRQRRPPTFGHEFIPPGIEIQLHGNDAAQTSAWLDWLTQSPTAINPANIMRGAL